MQNKQIITEILRYLNDENYRYAVLIDGNWGCGKTYFVLHDLKSAIEKHEEENNKRDIKYISLYGCESVEDVEQNIYWSIIDKKFYDLTDRIKKNMSDVYGEKEEKRNKHQRIVMTAAKKIIGTAMQKFEIEGKNFEVVAEFVSLDKHIFIFDDLERCNCSINDILGYINSLVEHEGAKVILVANESEIGQLEKREYREWQNLVAAQANILIPEEQLFGSREKKKPLKEFSLDELERRRSEIFSSVEWDEKYKQIREKLIGVTIHYNPDVVMIMHSLISKFKGDKQFKERLSKNVQFFINEMEGCHHLNFRTFQFFLSKIEYLYPKLELLNVENRYEDKVQDFVVKNCFEICIEFKANMDKPRNPIEKILYGKKLRLQSIKEYVENSNFELDKLKKEIDQYIKEELFKKIAFDDPLNQLNNNWYLMDQTWVEEQIKEVLEKLNKGEYHVNAYRGILLILMRMQWIGFPEKNLLQAVVYMKADLKKKGEFLSEEWYLIEDVEFANEYKQLVININQELKGGEHPSKNIEKMLEDKEKWGGLLHDYAETDEAKKHWKQGFLCSVGAEKWVKIIKESDAKNIYSFRQFLQYALPDNVVREGIKADMPTVNKILDGLGAIDDIQDLIKRQVIKWLIKDLEKAKYLFTVTYAKDYERM